MRNLKEIPFELLTAGQTGLSIKEVYARKVAAIEEKKGNSSAATEWTNRANILSNLMPTIHSNQSVLQNFYDFGDQWLNGVVQENKSLRYIGLKEDRNLLMATDVLGNLNNNPQPFDPSQSQIDACLAEGNRRYGTASSRSKTNFVRTCIARIPYKNIITEHVGQSGGVLLYTTIKNSNSNFNATIAQKDLLQSRWVQQAAVATGLPQIQVLDVLAISVMDQFGETPQNIESGLKNFMAPIGSGGQNIVAQTQTPDIIFPTGGSSMPASKEGAIINLIIQIATVIVNLFNHFKKRNEEAKRREAAFAETPQIEDNFIVKCWDFNGLQRSQIDCSVEGAIKKCYDPATGKEVDCQTGKEIGGSNGLVIAAGVTIVIGITALVLGRNKTDDTAKPNKTSKT